MTQSRERALSRRQVLGLAAVMVATGLPFGRVRADAASTAEAVAKLTGGGSLTEGRIKLDVPEIAENGNTVPIKFSVESPMSDADHVKSVHLFAEDNPLPNVASFHFTPASGKAAASTRMRLAMTQNVIAVAEMSDGSLYTAKKEIKVTIGGCGG